MQRGKAAHRQADEVRGLDRQGVEHGADVVAGAVLRIALHVVGHVGGRIAARVVGNAAVTPAEMPHLQFPRTMVAGEFMHEDDRDARADLFIEKLRAIVRCQMRHERSPTGGIIANAQARQDRGCRSARGRASPS